MSDRLSIVVLGLTLSSSWGNGHATTYRALLKAFAARGHAIHFLERDVPWYQAHRDLPDPSFCRLSFYDSLEDLGRFQDQIARADAVVVGSYVPEGRAVGAIAQRLAKTCAFYDIDTPVTMAKLARGEHDYLSPDQIAGYHVYLSFTGGTTLSLLERQYGSPDARALYCSVDPEAYPAVEHEKRWDLSYMGTYSPDRQPALQRLLLSTAERLPTMRFAVAGPQYPAALQWPANVERIEHVAPSDHAAFYAQSRFTLNITRADMIAAGFSPSVRLFEAASTGTPIITDRWEGLETIFKPDEEILTVSTADEVVAHLVQIPETQRRQLAARARETVLAGHTAAHRAEDFETCLRRAIRRSEAMTCERA